MQLTGPALRAELHRLSEVGHRKWSYERVDEILEVADQDPADSFRVLDIYLNVSFEKHATPQRTWQMEHAWPVSRGFDPDEVIENGRRRGEDCNLPLSDAHHLFVAHPTANGSAGHGKRRFDDCPRTRACTSLPVSTTPPAANLRGQDTWEVWSGRRGDIARAMLYLDVRYDGGVSRVEQTIDHQPCFEPDLVLTDDVGQIEAARAATDTVAFMGVLSTLIRWHFQDPVGPQDTQHHEAVATMQGNRNPFIDHPELVCRVYALGPCEPRVWLPWVAR